jgi:hypothetical protein
LALRITVFIFLFFTKIAIAQDSTLVGRFSLGILPNIGKSNIAEESLSKGFVLQFKYFANPKFAFSMSQGNGFTSITHNSSKHRIHKKDIGLGAEYHHPFGKFSPFVGLEAGLSFFKTSSPLVKASYNQYFLNNLALYFFKPKAGLMYSINHHLKATCEAALFWSYHPEDRLLNPLTDHDGKQMFFGRKTPTVSVGVHYMFNE